MREHDFTGLIFENAVSGQDFQIAGDFTQEGQADPRKSRRKARLKKRAGIGLSHLTNAKLHPLLLDV
jgi:hypothetical protein